MKSHIWIAAAAAALSAAAVPAAVGIQPDTGEAGEAVDWRTAARQDVLAAYDLFVANHPGMHDPGNPGFPAQLARARDQALAVAERATSHGGYAEAMGAFSGELSDGHALVVADPPSDSAPVRQTWPGFVAAWRGAGLVVHSVGENAPAPVGSAIVSCGGAAAADLVRARLGRGGLRASEAGQWWMRSPLVFLDREPPRPNRPQRCVFRTPGGEEREAALTWFPVPADIGARRLTASDGERSAIGLTEPRPGIFVIGLSDFQPDDAGVAAYRRLFAALRERRLEMLRARAIVLDMRGNNGGSSDWPQEVAAILWGEAVVDSMIRHHLGAAQIWWRASPGNIAYMAELEQRLRRDGHGDTADAMRAIAGGMNTSLAEGRHFFVEHSDQIASAEQSPPPRSDFDAPVFAITPGRCASACLDALDIFTRFANTRLIGAPTSGDSTYMDVRVAPLPSGHARIVIPNKVYVGRPRRSGEVYTPHILEADADWSTATFLDHIERDLAGRR